MNNMCKIWLHICKNDVTVASKISAVGRNIIFSGLASPGNGSDQGIEEQIIVNTEQPLAMDMVN